MVRRLLAAAVLIAALAAVEAVCQEGGRAPADTAAKAAQVTPPKALSEQGTTVQVSDTWLSRFWEDRWNNPSGFVGTVFAILVVIVGLCWAAWRWLFRWLLSLRAGQLVAEVDKLRKEARELRAATEESTKLHTELESARGRIAALESSETFDWKPERRSRIGWDKAEENGFLRRLEVPTPPYMVSCMIERRRTVGMRTGVGFLGTDHLDVIAVVCLGVEEGGEYLLVYTQDEGGAGAGLLEEARKLLPREETAKLRSLRVAVHKGVIAVALDGMAWDSIMPEEMGSPHLIAWCDDGVCDPKVNRVALARMGSSEDELFTAYVVRCLDFERMRSSSISLSGDELDAISRIRGVISSVGLADAGEWASVARLLPELRRSGKMERSVFETALLFMWKRGEVERQDVGPGEVPSYRLNRSYKPKGS